MRKFLNLALIGALALGFQACSSEEQLTDGSENIVKDGFYLQLSINYTGDADSRAVDMTDPEDSGLSQVGIEDEYTVNSAYLYIFRAQDGVFEAVEGLGTAKSTPNDGLSNPKRIAAALKTNTPYHAYLICNHKYTNRDGSAADPTTEDEFTEHIQCFDDSISEYMPMTSRSSDGRLYASFTLTADNYRTSEDPVVLSFSVERTYARIALDVEGIDNYCYDIYSSENEATDRKKVGVIYLDRYRVLNYLPDGYLFRHVGNLTHNSITALNGITSFGPVQSTSITNGNHYVITPYTIAATASDFSNYKSDSKYTLISNCNFDTSLSGTNLAILGYVNENTVHSDLQVKGNLTNIFLRGAIVPDASLVKGLDTDGSTLVKDTYTQGQVLYYDLRNMCFYNSFKAVQVAIKNTQVEDEITDLRAYNIVKYPEGYIYFQYFIRHRVATTDDHSDIHEKDKLGVMEYAMVRNNTYNIKITDVVMPGNPTDDYDPVENAELSEYYLKAKLDVKPWIVKSQSVDLGGN
jgi:hypothetical protein